MAFGEGQMGTRSTKSEPAGQCAQVTWMSWLSPNHSPCPPSNIPAQTVSDLVRSPQVCLPTRCSGGDTAPALKGVREPETALGPDHRPASEPRPLPDKNYGHGEWTNNSQKGAVGDTQDRGGTRPPATAQCPPWAMLMRRLQGPLRKLHVRSWLYKPAVGDLSGTRGRVRR